MGISRENKRERLKNMKIRTKTKSGIRESKPDPSFPLCLETMSSS